MNPFRQLPDGTWYNKAANVVAAPLTDAPATRVWKDRVSPPAGAGGALVRPPILAPQVAPAASLSGYYPGAWGLKMRHGRNYAALGADSEPSKAQRVLGFVAIIAVAGAVVWWQNRKKRGADSADQDE